MASVVGCNQESVENDAVEGDVAKVTRIINGGTTGLAERMALVVKTNAILSCV